MPKKLNYTTAIGATAFIFMCYAYPAEHRSPKGGYSLVITEDDVRIVDEAGTTMASPLEKADLDKDDGWEFESIKWNNQETLCVLHGRWGNHRRFRLVDVFQLDSDKSKAFKKINDVIVKQFQEILARDADRDKDLKFGMRSVTLKDGSAFSVEFRPLSGGGGQWNDDPNLDHYEVEFELGGSGPELRNMYRIRRTLIQ